MSIIPPGQAEQAFEYAWDVAYCYATNDIDGVQRASTMLANCLSGMDPEVLKNVRSAARVLINSTGGPATYPEVCTSRSCPSMPCPACGYPGRPTLVAGGGHRHGRYRCSQPGCRHSPYGHGTNPREITGLAETWMSWMGGTDG